MRTKWRSLHVTYKPEDELMALSVLLAKARRLKLRRFARFPKSSDTAAKVELFTILGIPVRRCKQYFVTRDEVVQRLDVLGAE
jgi:hypothetical protein